MASAAVRFNVHVQIKKKTLSVGVGPKNVLVINVFHRGPCGSPSRSNWTRFLLEGDRTNISKELIANCNFFVGWGEAVSGPPVHLWIRP